MKKILLRSACLILANLSFISINSQEYERSWGTYFGPSGTLLNGTHQLGMVLDSQKNMYARGTIVYSATTPSSYYNQFLVGGGTSFNPSTNNSLHNLFAVTFSPNGIPSYFGYQGYLHQTPTSETRVLANIDPQDNKIDHYYAQFNSPMNATPGTWIQTNPEPNSKNMLIKKSSSGATIWATYLPDKNFGHNITSVDSQGNIYITGTTLLQNISTPGVFQENFDVIVSQGSIVDNSYVAKLNSNGELLWATYLPSTVNNVAYYDNALYMITTSNTNVALNTMSTPGAFQSTVSDFSITKINASNGQREWGSYFGPAKSLSFYLLYDLAVNESGLYLTGTDFNINNSNFFATPNTYKTQVTGGSDLFLTKFSHSGERLWGTYFGGNGEDINTFDKVIDLNGGEIFITGTTTGSTDNISTAGAYQTTPSSNNSGYANFYFAKFNSTGNLEWSSYYGGGTSQTSYMKSINIKYDSNSLFLYGNTNYNTGFTTPGAFMPTRNPETSTENTGYFARFDQKGELSVNEAQADKNLVLYNNPNNGNFTISGNILQKEACSMVIYDISGKLITSQKLSQNKSQQFNLETILSSGNYLLQVNNENGEKIKVFKMNVKK